MALVVEDGTKMDTSSPLPNTYVDAEGLSAFATLRGLDDIAASGDTQLEIALIKAVDYMQEKYRLRWKGSRVRGFQPLDWPRRGVDIPDFFDPFFRQSNVPINFQDTLYVGEDTVPEEVRTAQSLLAIATYSGDESTGVLQGSLGRVTKREKLGSLEVEYFNAEDGSSRQTTIYWDAKMTIQPFLLASEPFGGRLIRG
jgi:hypothetical protein